MSTIIGKVIDRVLTDQYGLDHERNAGILKHLLWDATLPTVETLLKARYESGYERAYLLSTPTCCDFALLGNLIVLINDDEKTTKKIKSRFPNIWRYYSQFALDQMDHVRNDIISQVS
jgi:hypothetical protein